jgi:hypothetical protein
MGQCVTLLFGSHLMTLILQLCDFKQGNVQIRKCIVICYQSTGTGLMLLVTLNMLFFFFLKSRSFNKAVCSSLWDFFVRLVYRNEKFTVLCGFF